MFRALEMSVFQIIHGGNLTFINMFNKTKFSCVILMLDSFTKINDKV